MRVTPPPLVDMLPVRQASKPLLTPRNVFAPHKLGISLTDVSCRADRFGTADDKWLAIDAMEIIMFYV